MGLISLTEAKQYLEITTTKTDDLLNALILSVTDFMKNSALNRNLESVDRRELYNGNGLSRLALDEFPIISLSVLSQNINNADHTYSDPLTSGTDFYIEKGGFVELFQDVFQEGQRNVYVIYTSGYAIIPGEIKDICKVLVAKRMQDVQGKRFGITTKNIFDDSVSYETGGLSPDMKAVLKKYRKRPTLTNGVSVFGAGWAPA